MNKKFKLSTIFSLISSFILLIFGIVGVIYFSSQERFILFFEEYMNLPINTAGTTLKDQLLYVTNLENFIPLMYIMFIAYSVFNIISAIVCLVLSFICLNDYHLSCKVFQNRKPLHIAYIVFVGISWFSVEVAVGSLISILLVLLNLVVNVLYLIAFIFGIISIRYNTKRFAELHSDNVPLENVNVEEFNEGKGQLLNSTFNEDQSERLEDLNQEKLSDEWKEELQEKQDEIENQEVEKEGIKPTIDNEKLNQTYELLAKLEKSHRNQEISDDDYERMKKTIMDNLLK